MTKRRELRSIASIVALATALLLPSLSLVPLGGIWLWQNGWLLHWAVGAALVVSTVYAIERWFLRHLAEPRDADNGSSGGVPTTGWTPAETSAWEAVQEVATRIDAERLDSRDAVLELGRATIEAVARRLHPEVAEPVWQFTLPEALAIAERVSRRMGKFVETSLPLSDRLTVAQVLALYRWRGAIGVAERAYDVWRLIRIANPMTAATQELRERLARQMLAWGQTHVTERLARAYVEEVGRAAIDLYGGRLKSRRDADLALGEPTSQETIDQTTTEPLRLLLAGHSQRSIAEVARLLGAGDMSVQKAGQVHTLPFAGSSADRDRIPPLHLTFASSSGDNTKARERVAREAVASDLIVWATASQTGDSVRGAIDSIRETYAALRHRRTPPMLVVITDGSDGSGAGDAAKIASDLGVDAASIVVLSESASDATDAEHLWARLSAIAPDALHARTTRLAAAPRRWRDWGRTLSQTVNAGRTIARTFGKR